MANQEHVERLRAGVEAWNSWRADWHLTPDLRDADLERVQAVGANLSGCDCRGANLFGARLTRANLQNSSFEGAVLRQTFLFDVRLDGATFDNADLSNSEMKSCQALGVIEPPRYDRTFSTTFRQASLKECYIDEATLVSVDFSGADLRGARLNGTTFRRTRFTGANLSGARIGGTNFIACQLADAKGLNDLIHEGNSIVDLPTLRLAFGRLPSDFLRRAGLAKWEVAASQLYAPELPSATVSDLTYEIFEERTAKPIQTRQVFLSYSWLDAEFVTALGQQLSRHELRYWRDVHDLVAGPIEQQVDRAIALCTAVVVVLSRHSIHSDWVEWEVGRARQAERDSQRHRICPVALDEAWKSAKWSAVLRTQLEKYYILDFSSWDREEMLQAQTARLITGLKAHYLRP